MPVSNYYDILGLPRTASQEEIKQAYRMYSKKYHPDINPDPNAAAMFRLINEAYSALTSPQHKSEVVNTYEDPQEYTDLHTDEEPSYRAQEKGHAFWWKIPLRVLRFLVRALLAAITWLLKFPIIIIGMIGYLFAAVAGIGMIFAVVKALSGKADDWMLALAIGIGAIVLYLLTLLSSYLLGLLDDLRDWLLHS